MRGAILVAVLALAGCEKSETVGIGPREPAASTAPVAIAAQVVKKNAYRQVNLVANKPEFKPQILDPLLVDGWGLAIRPPGAGGHFWINNAGSGTTTTYVGDVEGVPLFQDELKTVYIPSSRLYGSNPDRISQPTGMVYTGYSLTDFMVAGENVSGPSKFVFCSLDGSVTGWTTGMTRAVTKYDNSPAGSMYTGMAVTLRESGNLLYLCDFGLERTEVLDHEFRPVKTQGNWADPNVPKGFSTYNMQWLEDRLYVMWARIGDDPGEEDVYPGYGYISEFDAEGNHLASFEHRMELNAPWGAAIAPENFGALSGMLLISNFGDGTIVAYDRATRKFVDYLRDEAGEPVMIDGIWGILFGNGVKLGRTNHLYFAAGPNVEEDGIFGKLEPVTP